MRADAVQQLRDVHGPDRVLELLPGLFRLPIPLPRNPLRELNAYLIRGRERSLLIETGLPGARVPQASPAGCVPPGRCTIPGCAAHPHSHRPHRAGLGGGAPRGRPSISGGGTIPSPAGPGRRNTGAALTSGFSRRAFPRRSCGSPPAPTRPGPWVRTWTCPITSPWRTGTGSPWGNIPWRSSAAPGHTPGQICLWMANQQVLFTADHVLFDITPNITMWPNLPNALGRYLESLTRIGTYRPGWPSRPPAHGGFGPPDSGPSGPPPAAGGGDAGHCPAGGGTERLPGGQPHDLGYPGRQLGGLSPESEVVRHGRGPGQFGIPGGGGAVVRALDQEGMARYTAQ